MVTPSAMAGIGEASATLSVVLVGLSLVITLNTYLSDLSDARDDISSLVSDIEATLGQLRDLGKLIEKNESTKAWSEDGLRDAQKCVTDCEKIITKLRNLLKKSTASVTSEEVNERSALRAELTKQRISPQQMEEIINHMHPPEQVDSDLHLVSRTVGGDKASSAASGDSPAEAVSTRW